MEETLTQQAEYDDAFDIDNEASQASSPPPNKKAKIKEEKSKRKSTSVDVIKDMMHIMARREDKNAQYQANVLQDMQARTQILSKIAESVSVFTQNLMTSSQSIAHSESRKLSSNPRTPRGLTLPNHRDSELFETSERDDDNEDSCSFHSVSGTSNTVGLDE